MSLNGIFINGVFAEVLRDICKVQNFVPDQILYLQPFAGKRIVELSDNPPSTDSAVRLFLSLTDDLPTVRYTGEIVGWDDKRGLVGSRREIIDKVIRRFQPTEEGIYPIVRGVECVNLISVWRMRELLKPFSVTELIKVSNNQPYSANRQQAGSWSHVMYPSQDWLESHFSL